MLDKPAPYLQRHHRGVKGEALRALWGYVAKRITMTDYPRFREMGYDCGSGPTGSFCGTLTARPSRAGGYAGTPTTPRA
ncbi:MAG: hypothetical protein JW709_10300 [Sedimentisphaerales bacterium]|nr:hypothetical protein [Sedimentisphaerales bacterium]